jgi:hypothetical protein
MFWFLDILSLYIPFLNRQQGSLYLFFFNSAQKFVLTRIRTDMLGCYCGATTRLEDRSLHSFQIIRYFDFSRYIVFIMHLDIVYI